MNIENYHKSALTIIKGLIVLFLPCLMLLYGCQKEFLEKKPNRAQLVPTRVSDFQAISDDVLFFHAPGIQEISSDDFVISDLGLFTFPIYQVNVYKWAPNAFAGQANVQDWSLPHSQIFTANLILEGLDKIHDEERDSPEFNHTKGAALFNRAFAYYNLAQLFIAPYNPANANSLPGIPLRLVSDLNANYPRGTVQQTYDQIIKDLNAALPLLPDVVNYKNRPCKAAGLALLARLYLSINDYEHAELYADQALKIKHDLLDYSAIKGNATSRLMPSALPNGNVEVILYRGTVNYAFPGVSSLATVIEPLYNSYGSSDLRKVLFFRDRGNGIFTWRGTYGGAVNPVMFNGLAVDELFLIRAECAARRGNLTLALSDLNTLLATRFVKGFFQPYTGTDKEEVLSLVLLERRKELIARGLRWTDLRRLNMDPRFVVSPKRTIAGTEYTLIPNSNRYTFPIPDNEIGDGGLIQNPY